MFSLFSLKTARLGGFLLICAGFVLYCSRMNKDINDFYRQPKCVLFLTGLTIISIYTLMNKLKAKAREKTKDKIR